MFATKNILNEIINKLKKKGHSMKHKLLKLNVLLLLELGLTPLQGETTLNVKATGGTQTAYSLTTIRKLTFPCTCNMTVTKTTATTDKYTLSGVRYLNFSDMGTGIASPSAAVKGILHLYPNPVTDVLNIELSATGSRPATVELLSIEGKVLYKGQFAGTRSYQINVSQFRQGIYLCRVNNGTSIETTKFCKQ